MCCSYCGKEIGAFHLLKDREFCCALHRRQYGERLGKALHTIAAPEPAPAGVTGFRVRMPVQQGNLTSHLIPELAAACHGGVGAGIGWPLTIDPGEDAAAESARADCPTPCRRPLPLPAEGVEAFLRASACLVPVSAPSAHPPVAGLEFAPATRRMSAKPSACDRWMAAPQAESVEAFRQVSASLACVATLAPCLPAGLHLAGGLDEAILAPPLSERRMPALRAEPVEACLRLSAALTPVRAALPPQFTAGIEFAALSDSDLDGGADAPDRGRPAAWRDCNSASEERLQADPRGLGSPLHQWMAAPGPDPVCNWLSVSTAPAAIAPSAVTLPRFALMTATTPRMSAEPAFPPAPGAVESWLTTAQSVAPISIRRVPATGAKLAQFPTVPAPVLTRAQAIAGLSPQAVESGLAASLSAAMAWTSALRLPRFTPAACPQLRVAHGSAQNLAPAPRPTETGRPRQDAPPPVATLAAATPSPAGPMLEFGLPRPGLQPIEFHTRRSGGAPTVNSVWLRSRLALRSPRFPLRPLLEKLEDPLAQAKAARQDADRFEALRIPAAKRQTTVLMIAFRVAAGFLLAATLWVGASNFLGERRVVARGETLSRGAALSSESAAAALPPRPGAPARSAPNGPVSWVRRAIANRASLKLAEDFRGMDNFVRSAQGTATGWARHPDGYMNTGALALFRPSLKFTDYRVEFFGQIENKSLGWTVRTTDPLNYHAMKLTVMEAGLRPFVALVHYDVVNGKAGHRTRTPLGVMVHNNRPLQLAVDVRGSLLVTSIDGEEVDSFSLHTASSGGVGFFSEAGERARLYWMRISRNDDWLGHVCAMLSDGGTAISAEMREPECPGGTPAPGLPGDGDMRTMAAAWAGLPYLRRARKTGFLTTWRSQPWNT